MSKTDAGFLVDPSAMVIGPTVGDDATHTAEQRRIDSVSR